MVLSKKKLKQELKTALLESQNADVNGDRSSDADALGRDPSSKLQSLKERLILTTKKRKLYRKEKRRSTSSSTPNDLVNGKDGSGVENDSVEGQALEVLAAKKKKKNKKKSIVFDDRICEGSGSPDETNSKEGAPERARKKEKHEKKAKGQAHTMSPVGETVEDGDRVLINPQKDGESSKNDNASEKIYVGGIPYYSTEDDIRSYFEHCGTIMEVDCKNFSESGKFRGIAIVSFKTEAAARRALALDGSDMGGLYLKVQPYEASESKAVASDFSPEIVTGYRRIYVGNLSWDITEHDLKKLFCDCTISIIRLGLDKETGEFRGYAHVDFADELSFVMALKLDQEVVHGRPVRIRCAVSNRSVGSQSRERSERNGCTCSGLGSGKNKRRTCYECGIAGHLSSSCPKKQIGKNSNYDHEGTHSGIKDGEKDENGNGVSFKTSGSGVEKKKRRTCYECGIARHLSSACPKKQR